MSATLAQTSLEYGPGPFPLQRDILWEIFSICANMDPEYEDQVQAVDTLRHLSQVSSTWRNLILASSSLWGRVVDLIQLEHSREWLNEVVKRTKDSWLHVKARVEFDEHGDEDHDNFVRLFITEHWRRIRNFNLIIFFEYEPFEEARAWLSLLSSESNIRHLKIVATAQVSVLLPLLFSQIEVVEILDDPRCMVDIGGQDNLSLSDPEVSLPNLRRLKIKSCWTPSVAGVMGGLQRITPADGCVLYLDCSVNAFIGDLDLVVNSVPFVLPKYLHHARAAWADMEGIFASIVITESSVDFTVMTSILFPDTPEFRFALRFEDGTEVPAHLIPNFISCFESFQPFNEIKALSLVINPPAPRRSDLTIRAMKQFVRTFASIEALEIDCDTLHHLENYEDLACVISFPALKDITVNQCGNLSHDYMCKELPCLLGGSLRPQIHTSP